MRELHLVADGRAPFGQVALDRFDRGLLGERDHAGRSQHGHVTTLEGDRGVGIVDDERHRRRETGREQHRLRLDTPPAPGQLLSAQRTVEVLAALQAQADVVLIDTPIMAAGNDAAVVASISDAALVIAGAPSGQAGELARAVDLLDAIEGLVVGVVLNAVADDDHDGRVAMLRRDMPRVSLA